METVEAVATPPPIRRSRWRRCLLVASLVCALAVAVLWLLSRGQAWSESRGEAERRWAEAGLAAAFADVVPPEVPPDSNFATSRWLPGIGAADEDGLSPAEVLWRAVSCDGRGSLGRFSHSSGERLRLAEWAEGLAECGQLPPPAADDSVEHVMLEATADIGAAVRELAERLDRPYAQLAPGVEVYSEIGLRHTAGHGYAESMKALVNALALRTSVLLQAGDAAEALLTLRVAFRSAEVFAQSPTNIDALVAVGSVGRALGPVWEALEARAFGADQLMTLQLYLEGFEFRKIILRALEGDALLLVRSVDSLADKSRAGGGAPVEAWLPLAALDANVARVLDWNLDYSIVPLRDIGWSAAVERGEDLQQKIEEAMADADIAAFVSALGIVGGGRMAAHAAITQCWCTQAEVASALERYFIATDSYPVSLDQLVPEYLDALPLDPIDETTMRYAREGDRYKLWSVGLDGIDDGGEETKNGGLTKPSYRGDWVWRYSKTDAQP